MRGLLSDEVLSLASLVHVAAAGGEDGEYVLRVQGQSMIDAGILEGDFVVVRPQDDASDGEIVVAMVGDDEATVKRFFRESDHI